MCTAPDRVAISMGCESLEARVRSPGIVIAPPVLDDLPRLRGNWQRGAVQGLITQDLAETEVAGYGIK